MDPETDVAIIGGGPAGLTAAVYSARMGLRTTVFEAKKIGGALKTAKKIENYPGFQSITGEELAERMRTQTESCGANIVYDTVQDLKPEEMRVISTKEEWKTKAVIICTGSKRKKLGLSNERALEGYGLSYCAVCDGPIYGNKVVAIVGGGSTAANDAIFLSGKARKVYLIHDKPNLNTSKELAEQVLGLRDLIPLFNTSIEEAKTKQVINPGTGEPEDVLRKLSTRNLENDEISELRVRALFVALGEDPFKLAKLVKIETDKSGAIIVDKDQKTNIDGIYAAGDVTGGIKQIGTAVGEGIIAAMRAGYYIKKKIRTKN